MEQEVVKLVSFEVFKTIQIQSHRIIEGCLGTRFRGEPVSAGLVLGLDGFTALLLYDSKEHLASPY